MRFTRCFLIGVLSTSLFAFGLAACSDDDTPATPTPGTGTDAGSDTSTTADTGSGAVDSGGGGSDTGTADTGTVDAGATGVTVHVNYTGNKTGGLVYAIFPGSTFPMGAPAAAFTQPTPVTFPATHTFTLPAGPFIVSAYVDVGNDSPTGPGATDPASVPPFTPITVTAGSVGDTTVTLQDPDGG